jgi:hemoglobin-like flavoprotein
MLDFIVNATQWSASDWQATVSQERDLFLVVLALGRRHHALYRVPQEAYPVVSEALIWTLDYGLGEAFTEDVRETWKKTYQLITSVMLMGSKNQIPAT